MAYEFYKRMLQHVDGQPETDFRIPLRLIRENNNYAEGLFTESWFLDNKAAIESSICGPNQLVVIPDLG